MIARQQSRRAAALAIILTVLLWAQAGVATMPDSGHGPQCHGHMSGMHSQAHEMSAGCCPRHARSSPGCPAHSKLLVVESYRPDCCAISNRPSQPVAFVVTSRPAMQSGTRVATSPDLIADRTDRPIGPDDSPPFIHSIFDKKADLRI